jgi:hypothetical protein
MKYFIVKQGKPTKVSFTIEELREEKITPNTLVRADIEGNNGEEQSYKSADKFEELTTLFSVPEPSIPLSIVISDIKEKDYEIEPISNFSIEDDTNIKILPVETDEKKTNSNPSKPNVKTIYLYTIVGLLVILSVAYWLTKKPPFPPPISGSVSDTISPKTTDCKAKSDSLLKIGEQNIEQANGESLTAFGLMKDYKDCADTAKIKALKAKFNSQITTDEAIINDPDIQKRNTQFKEAIKLLDEIITPNQ